MLKKYCYNLINKLFIFFNLYLVENNEVQGGGVMELIFLFSLIMMILAIAILNTSKVEKLEKRIKQLEEKQ